MAEHSHKMSPKTKIEESGFFQYVWWEEHSECVIITNVSARLPKNDRCEYI